MPLISGLDCTKRARLYKTGTLWHSDAYILFPSAKVVLDQRKQNTFSKRNAPRVLLSLTPTRSSLNGCQVAACFLGLLHSSSSLSVSCSHLSPRASYSNPPYLKIDNFRKASNVSSKWMFIGLKNFLTNRGRPYTTAPEMAWNMQMLRTITISTLTYRHRWQRTRIRSRPYFLETTESWEIRAYIRTAGRFTYKYGRVGRSEISIYLLVELLQQAWQKLNTFPTTAGHFRYNGFA